METLAVRPGDCLYVGDSDIDHAVASASGVPFLLVDYGYAPAGWDRSGVTAFVQFADLVEAISVAHTPVSVKQRAA